MWTTVYVAYGRENAANIEVIAKKEGFYIRKQYIGREGHTEMFEIMTLESEAEELYKILLENNVI